MPERKNILIISGLKVFPPQTGGHIRTAGIARSLARRGYRVRLYSLAGRREDYGSGRHQAEQSIEEGLVEEVNLGWVQGVLQTIARRLGLPRVWQYWLVRNGWIPSSLRRQLSSADLVLCDLPYTPPMRGPWRQKPWYLISHNLEHRILAIGGPREQRFVGWMQRVESRAPIDYDDILACAPEDQAFFRQHDAAGRCVIPIVGSAVDPLAYQVAAGVRESVRAELGIADDELLIAFSGSRFGPNITALAELRAFCEREAGFLAEQRIRFLVLGSIEPAAYREGALIATGRVAEIPPYLAAADAGFNPVTTGSGANVKIFEYLAARLPVLSTRFGARGTELRPEQDYLEFDAATLKAQLASLRSLRSRQQWQDYAEAVWQRHRHYADMGEVVAKAVAQLRGFRLADTDVRQGAA